MQARQNTRTLQTKKTNHICYSNAWRKKRLESPSALRYRCSCAQVVAIPAKLQPVPRRSVTEWKRGEGQHSISMDCLLLQLCAIFTLTVEGGPRSCWMRRWAGCCGKRWDAQQINKPTSSISAGVRHCHLGRTLTPIKLLYKAINTVKASKRPDWRINRGKWILMGKRFLVLENCI